MSVSSSTSASSSVSSMFSNKLDKMFSKSDADGDGKLNFSEFMAAGQNMPGVQGNHAHKAGKGQKGDGKDDGKGNLLEQLMAILDKANAETAATSTDKTDSKDLADKVADVKNQAIKDLFSALDTIRDQKRPAAKPGDDKGREDLFKAMDKDGDGSLTKNEMKGFHDQKVNEARAAILQVQELFGKNTSMVGSISGVSATNGSVSASASASGAAAG